MMHGAESRKFPGELSFAFLQWCLGQHGCLGNSATVCMECCQVGKLTEALISKLLTESPWSAAHKAGLSLQRLQRSSHYPMIQRFSISHNAVLSDVVQSPQVEKTFLSGRTFKGRERPDFSLDKVKFFTIYTIKSWTFSSYTLDWKLSNFTDGN